MSLNFLKSTILEQLFQQIVSIPIVDVRKTYTFVNNCDVTKASDLDLFNLKI